MTPRRQKEILIWLCEKPQPPGVKEIEEPTPFETYEYLCSHMTAAELREVATGKYGERFTTNVNTQLIRRMQFLNGQEQRSGNGRVSTGLPAQEEK